MIKTAAAAETACLSDLQIVFVSVSPTPTTLRAHFLPLLAYPGRVIVCVFIKKQRLQVQCRQGRHQRRELFGPLEEESIDVRCFSGAGSKKRQNNESLMGYPWHVSGSH